MLVNKQSLPGREKRVSVYYLFTPAVLGHIEKTEEATR
jgi:hypothetical protein